MKKFLSLFSCLALTACAEPQYFSPAPLNQQPLESTQTPCEAKFSSGQCLTLRWEVLPSEKEGEEFGAFLFKTFRANQADGSPLPEDLPGPITVDLWMPSMNHGSSPVEIRREDVGTYRVKNVFFSMRGAWEIRFFHSGIHEISLPYTF